jgi:hypothetical protein
LEPTATLSALELERGDAMRRRIWLSGVALTALALLIVQGAAAD